MRQSETFSIRQMVELTGLSEFTIRGWENRYSAFKPLRGETGRREYLKADLERALLLRELLKRGHKIGAVAALDNRKLKELFKRLDGQHSREEASEGLPDFAKRAIELMVLQKWSDLEFLIKDLRMKDGRQLVAKVFLPLLQALSVNVNAGLVSIAQEHVFSSFLKERIYSALSELGGGKETGRPRGRARFVLAAPEGDYHEIGLLLAHLLIRSYGFRSLYLGVHTPSRDLSETALRFDATHVLIVSTVSKSGGARQELLSYLSDVQEKVGPALQILLAGGQAPTARQPKASLSVLPSFPALERFLEKLE